MKILLVAMLMCVSFFAVAQDLKIDGGVQMDVSAEQDVNASIGKDSIAAQSIGAIESGDLSGDIQIGVEAAEDVNAAIGDGACAQQEIGTIGKKDSC
mgnify:CR=1|jgi:hypothetical protein|tara:strand:- start:108 stop:398 length:291 start_codon:yes stop_codon:yes gene_type:complete